MINEIYLGKVRPTLDEINKEWTESSFGRNLLRDLLGDPKSFVASFVTFGLGELADLPLAASLGAAASSQVISTLSKQVSGRKQLSKNKMFLLRQIEQMAPKAG